MSVARRAPSRTFVSLALPNFRRFCIGQFISQAGTWMQTVTVGILVLRLTDSGVAVGLATVAQFGPLLVFGPWAGVLTDRRDVHHLLLLVNAAGGVVAALFAAAVLAGDPPLWVVYALTTASGFVLALENPVRRSFLSELVDLPRIPNAVSLNSTVMISSEAVGLAVAGALIGGVGLGACFVVNAVSFLPQLALFARIDRDALWHQPRVGRARGQLREGLRYTRHEPHLLRPLYLLGALGAFGFTAHTVAFPLYAIRDLHGDARTYTVLLTAVSIGSLVGTLSSARRNLADTTRAGKAAIAFGLCTALIGVAPNLVVATSLALVSGWVVMITVAGMNAEVQLRTAPEFRGRVLALVSMVLIGSGAVGGPVLGWVAERAGAPAALVASGAVAIAVASWVLRGVRVERRARADGCDGRRGRRRDGRRRGVIQRERR